MPPLRCRVFGHDVPMRGEIELIGVAKFERIQCRRCGVEWTIAVE